MPVLEAPEGSPPVVHWREVIFVDLLIRKKSRKHVYKIFASDHHEKAFLGNAKKNRTQLEHPYGFPTILEFHQAL